MVVSDRDSFSSSSSRSSNQEKCCTVSGIQKLTRSGRPSLEGILRPGALLYQEVPLTHLSDTLKLNVQISAEFADLLNVLSITEVMLSVISQY